MGTKIYVGNALDVLPKLEANSVHCSISSPPYYGLRKYSGFQQCEWPETEYSPMSGLPPIRLPGCDPDCVHEWGDEIIRDKRGLDTSSSTLAGPQQEDARLKGNGQFCQRCGGWRGALGNEPTIEMYIGHLVAIYREVHRVLREDGVAWCVMGDSFAQAKGHGHWECRQGKGDERGQRAQQMWRDKDASDIGLKQGDLMMVPHRLALALQADRWIVRNDVVYAKKACMPESVKGWTWQKHRIKVKGCSAPNKQGVRGVNLEGGWDKDTHPETRHQAEYEDCLGCPKCEPNGGHILKRGSWRHTRAHEFVLMCVKNMQYWSDQEKVREPHKWEHVGATRLGKRSKNKGSIESPVTGKGNTTGSFRAFGKGGRNPRSVLIPKPEPYPGKHFAVYPTSLIEPLIKATCPDKCCPECGMGWSPVVERNFKPQPDVSEEKGKRGTGSQKPMDESSTWQGFPRGITESNVLGYRPTCECGHDAHTPGTTLDPFLGSGTTALVAERLGLNTIGIELSETYARMAHDRITDDAPLLADVEIGIANGDE